MSAPAGAPPTATPPAAAVPPVAATPPVVATPPVAATPPVVASPPVVATPPVVSTPPPPVATPPVSVPPATAPVVSPPAPPPPVVTPPTALPPATPPVVSPPAPPPTVVTPPTALPPATPPSVSPPAPPPPTPVAPVSSPPSTSPPSPVSPPPPPTPVAPPPTNVSPPPPPAPGTPGSPPPPPSSPPPPAPPRSPPPPPRLSPPPPPVNGTNAGKSSGGGIPTTTVVGIAVGGVVALLLVAVVWIFLAKKKPKQKLNYAHRVGHSAAGGGGGGAVGVLGASNKSDGASSFGGRTEYLESGEIKPPPPPPGYSGILGGGGKKPIPPPPEGSPSAGSTRPWFTYEELEVATNGFAAENVLGEGGFGRVYKGTIAGNQLVAVKQLTIGGGQGEREFRAEVEIISRVHHRHLVSLVGYCIADSQRLLVYDFVPNGTLEHALHGKGQPIMDWATRMKIALGSARGLAYLHEDCHPRIIHRDIKASNILLDNQWEAQVADFGLAKLANDTHTHVTTRVMGTFGYLAPEYALSGKLTDKSDVYSFGVVLLELITGKKPVDVLAAAGEESLVEWARPILTQALDDENLDLLADPHLQDMYNEKEMMRMVEVAAACVRHSAQKRPKMAMVVRALETEGADLNQGVKPGYSTVYTGDSSEFDSSQYKANLKKFRQVAYGSTQFSSDYSAGNTSEYGIANSASSSEYGNSREHMPLPPPPPPPVARGNQTSTTQDSASSGDRSSDEVRLDVGDEASPRGTGVSPRGQFSNTGVGMSKFGPQTTGTLPLPPNRRPISAGLSVRSPRTGESVRSKSPLNQRPGHTRRGSGSSGSGPGIVNRIGTLFGHDYNAAPQSAAPPNYSRQYSGEFPESKYSTEDEGSKNVITADRLEEGSRPLLSAHKTKTVKFDFDG